MCQDARLLLPGGAGPLVICSDCYDNANIYSRTREYCPYAYLEEDDPLDRALPGLRESFSEHAQHKGTGLESLMSNHDSSVFLTSHDKRLSSHTPPEHYAKGETWKQKLLFYLLMQVPCLLFTLISCNTKTKVVVLMLWSDWSVTAQQAVIHCVF